MADHPIQGLMRTAMENLKQMVDVNTIIGDPVETPDGSVILPISKVGFGFAAGGSEFQYDHHHNGHQHTQQHEHTGNPFGGGSGGGVSITPVAFLVVGKQGIRSIPLENTTHLYDRILDSVPQIVDKVQGMFTKSDDTPVYSNTTIIAGAEEQDLEDLMDRK
ncbi:MULTISPECIES: GerW family sporulation protein [Bacillales]|uniref:GerW family sporulation protein n=1 Tax=Bacillales TaxID=1385 RepID=UPI00034CFCC6|nr:MULTISPECIES: GerW family sporulation protein [Bacillales]KMZ39946.1 spore protein [Bacillus sp. FJAT-27238]MBH0332598.1 spore protein [Brevibacillus brevis]NRR01664.1 sporulation protein YtfJ [Brevibacillus sp. RS1.1]OUQ86415.1 sporulation protein YtfJ [Brevibacillus brevis]TQR34100.1 sporulation protein YtfJ [Lysinibacillus sp. SDF0063]